MTPQPPTGMKPFATYQLTAFRQWMLDSECTPHLIVDASAIISTRPLSGVQEDGTIALTVTDNAVPFFHVNDDNILTAVRQNGVGIDLEIPLSALIALVCVEKKFTIPLIEMFSEYRAEQTNSARTIEESKRESVETPKKKAPHLKLVH